MKEDNKITSTFISMVLPMIAVLTIPSIKYIFARYFIQNISDVAITTLHSINTYLYTMNVFFITIISMSEILISKFYGKGSLEKTGNIAWQVIWISLGVSSFFYFLIYFFPTIIFPQRFLEKEIFYYCLIMQLSNSIYQINIAITSFFIGTRRSKIIIYSTVLNAVTYMVYAPYLIRDKVIQAAFPHIISHVVSCAFLIIFFFKEENKKIFGTLNYKLNHKMIRECINIAWPSAANHLAEMCTWAVLSHYFILLGHNYIANHEFISSLYRFTNCLSLAMERTTGALSASYLSRRDYINSRKVVKISIILHCISSIFIIIPIHLYKKKIVEILVNTCFICKEMYDSLIVFSFIYLVDGLAWILIGFLISAGDNKFVLFTHIVIITLSFTVPCILYYEYAVHPTIDYWITRIHIAYSMINLCTVSTRYLSNSWILQNEKANTQLK